MATRDAVDRWATPVSRGASFVIRPTRLATLHTFSSRYIVNRGRNTGAGAAYVYWSSPAPVDTTGSYYSGSVVFSQLTDIIIVGEYQQ
jgi:hypothetical protein